MLFSFTGAYLEPEQWSTPFAIKRRASTGALAFVLMRANSSRWARARPGPSFGTAAKPLVVELLQALTAIANAVGSGVPTLSGGMFFDFASKAF
jgi:hypothetical protein